MSIRLTPTEHDTQTAILQYLATMPGMFWRMNVGRVRFENSKGVERWVRFSVKGMSDIIGINKRGQLTAIEVKTPAGKLTPDQQKFLDDVNRWGGLSMVARSLDDVVTVFKTEKLTMRS